MATTDTDLTVGDILAKFGPIPVRRIRQSPEPGKATERDVEDIHDRENRLYELVDGILVEKTIGLFESRVAIVLAYFLQTFLDQKDLGIVLGSDGTMRLAPGLVRIPDVAFVSRERLGSGLPRQAIPDLRTGPCGRSPEPEQLREGNAAQAPRILCRRRAPGLVHRPEKAYGVGLHRS